MWGILKEISYQRSILGRINEMALTPLLVSGNMRGRCYCTCLASYTSVLLTNWLQLCKATQSRTPKSSLKISYEYHTWSKTFKNQNVYTATDTLQSIYLNGGVYCLVFRNYWSLIMSTWWSRQHSCSFEQINGVAPMPPVSPNILYRGHQAVQRLGSGQG